MHRLKGSHEDHEGSRRCTKGFYGYVYVITMTIIRFFIRLSRERKTYAPLAMRDSAL
jgi:hypothetical protein